MIMRVQRQPHLRALAIGAFSGTLFAATAGETDMHALTLENRYARLAIARDGTVAEF